MKRLNVKLLIVLLAGTVLLGGSVYGVWIFQMQRNALNYLKWAADAKKEDKLEEQANFLRRYLLYDPKNVKVQAEFALALTDLAEGPRTNRTLYMQAMSNLQKSLREDDKNLEIRDRLSLLLMKIGRANDAIQHLERLAAAYESNPEKHALMNKRLSECHVALGNDAKAIALLEEGIKQNPKDIETYSRLAWLHQHRKKDNEGAERVINEMVTANPASWEAFLMRYRHHTESARPEEAKQDLAQALQLGPTQLPVLLMAAERAAQENQHDQARAYLAQARKAHPDAGRVYESLYWVELRTNRLPEAIAALEDGLKEVPDDLMLLWRLGEAKLQAHDVEGTRAVIQRLEKANLPPERLDFVRARVLFEQQRPADALRVLDRIRPLFTQSPDFEQQIDALRVTCYQALGQIDQELAVLRGMLLKDPLARGPRIELARALLISGKLEDAIGELQPLAEADVGARMLLFQALISRNLRLPEAQRKWQETDDWMDRLMASGPDNIDVVVLVSDYLLKKGEGKKAYELLSKTRDKLSDQPRYWMALANVEDSKSSPAKSDPAAGLAVIAQAEEKLGDLLPLRQARIALLAELGNDDAKKQLLDLFHRVDDYPEAERSGMLQSLAMAFYSMRAMDEATQVFLDLARRSPNDVNSQIMVFQVQRDAADDAGMQASLDKIRSLVGEDNSFYLFCEAARIVSAVQRNQQPIAQLDSARKLLERAAAQRPNWALLVRLLGDIDERQGKFDEAIAQYKRALALGDSSPDMMRRLAIALVIRGRVDEVKSVLRDVPNLSQVVGKRIGAIIDLSEGEIDKAVELAKEAVAEDPDNYATQLWYARVLTSSGHAREAEQALRRAAELAPEIPDCWVGLTRFYAEQGREQDALAAIQQLQEKVPADHQRSVALALCHELLQDAKTAEADYQEALKAKPDDLGLLRDLASFYYRTNQSELFQKTLNKIVELGSKALPDDQVHVFWANRSLATLYGTVGSPQYLQQAITVLQRNERPDHPLEPDDLSLKASLYTRLGDTAARQAAIEILKDLVAKDPARVADQLQLALLYDRDGQWNDCKDRMIELLTAQGQGENPNVILNYADMLLRHDEPNEALPWVKKLEDLKLQNEPLYFTIKARLLAKQGNAAAAIELAKSQISRPLAPQQIPLLKAVAGQMVELSRGSTDPEPYLAAAEELFREYVAEAPSDTLVLALFLGNHRDLASAFQVCQQAIDRKVATESVCRVALALLREKPHQINDKLLEQGDAWLALGLKETPDSIALLLQLADFRDLQGRYDDAIAVYRKLLDRKDVTGVARVTVLNNLAFLLAVKDSNGEEAWPMIVEAIKEVGEVSELLDTRAMVQLALGKVNDAVQDLQRSVGSAPTGLKYFHLARAQLQNRNETAAAEAFEKSEKLGLNASTIAPLERDQFDKLRRSLPKQAALRS